MCLFKCSRQLSGCHLQFIYITGRGYKYMCVSWFKITFRADDRCVADCWVAARLKSGPPASPSTLPLTRSSVSWDGEVGKSWVIYEAAWERWEGPAIPCQEGTSRGEGLHTLKCHFLQFTSSLSPLPPRPGWEMRLMKNDSHYRLDPGWSLPLTPTSYKHDPIAVSQPFHLPHIYTTLWANPLISSCACASRLVMTMRLVANRIYW